MTTETLWGLLMVLLAAEIAGLVLIVIAFCAAKRLLTQAADELWGEQMAPPPPPLPAGDERIDGSWDGDFDEAIWGAREERETQRLPTIDDPR